MLRRTLKNGCRNANRIRKEVSDLEIDEQPEPLKCSKRENRPPVYYDIRAGGTAPAAPATAGAIFVVALVVVYKNIFTFKGKPTIELNYIFDMHAEGCGSEYVPMGRDHSEVQDSFLPEVGDKPNHPKTFTFPKQRFGDKKPTY